MQDEVRPVVRLPELTGGYISESFKRNDVCLT